MAKSKKKLAEEIIATKTADEMQRFLDGRTVDSMFLEEAFNKFLQDMHITSWFNWDITDTIERRDAAKYLAKFMEKFIEWTNKS